jgi:hypothetical protein
VKHVQLLKHRPDFCLAYDPRALGVNFSEGGTDVLQSGDRVKTSGGFKNRTCIRDRMGFWVLGISGFRNHVQLLKHRPDLGRANDPRAHRPDLGRANDPRALGVHRGKGSTDVLKSGDMVFKLGEDSQRKEHALESDCSLQEYKGTGKKLLVGSYTKSSFG